MQEPSGFFSTVSAGEQILLSLIGQKGNGPSYPLEFLSCRDRLQLCAVSKAVASHVQRIEYHRCKDGRLYRIPFPSIIGLLDKQPGDGLFPHQLASLCAIQKAENRCTDYGALRGGILGDAPGLGKSITMLAAIAATAGQRPRVPPDDHNETEVQEGWEHLSQNPSRLSDLIKCLKPFRSIQGYLSMVKSVTPPFELERFPTPVHFQRHVRQWAKTNGAYDIELEEFRKNVLALRSSMVKSNRKVLMSELGRRQAWERNLVPACSTLIIVPDALLEHWCVQCLVHLNLRMFADESTKDGRGVVYLDGVGDIVDASLPLGHVNIGKPLPSSWELARYTIVVTTFSRCKDEYRSEIGRNAEANSQGRKREYTQLERGGSDFHSTFMQVRWLRLVVDEGHELGSHDGGSQLTRYIHELAAERRWVMSGTPVVGNLDDSSFSAKALDQIQRLLAYLRHPTYGSVPVAVRGRSLNTGNNQVQNDHIRTKKEAKKAWTLRVKEPFLLKNNAGRDELLRVLREVSVIHNKEDISLPKPIFEFPEIDIALPLDVQRRIQEAGKSAENLLAAYLRSDEFQGLVDKTQGDYIVDSVVKARVALKKRGGQLELSGKMMMLTQNEIDAQAKQDRRAIKAVVYSSNKFNLRDVTEVLYNKLMSQNIAEAYDDRHWHPETELSRFRHNKKEVRLCPVCGRYNDHQGAVLDKRNAKCQNFLLEVVKRDEERVRFLIEPERVVRALPTYLDGNVTLDRMGGLEYERYGDFNRLWRNGDILEVNIDDTRGVFKKRQSQRQWKAFGMDKCIEMASSELYLGRDWFFGPLPQIQDDSTTMEVVLRKWQHCSTFHSPRWYTGPKLADSPVQTVKEDCFMLSLDAGLSHGLDLSFVTHIFLLEPVDDAALLEQITSRAHRLGATGPVTVCTVNTYFSLDPATEAAVLTSHAAASDNLNGTIIDSTGPGSSNKKKRMGGKITSVRHTQKKNLTKVVCQYCYRNFDTMYEAVTHEETKCVRNPANATARDPWHISSIYRELRPPPPYGDSQE